MKAIICPYCHNEIQDTGATQCPHCARPAISYPNVRAAQENTEKSALERRYLDAMTNAAKRNCRVNLEEFEKSVSDETRAVIASNLSDMSELLAHDKAIYTTYYQLLGGGAILPIDDEMVKYRTLSEDSLFHGYKEKIRFAALTIDDFGVRNYAKSNCGWFVSMEAHLFLKEDMIAHRTTLFEENNAMFVKCLNPRASDLVDFPKGFRAEWKDRGKLAAAKLEHKIDHNTTRADYSELLLHQGRNKQEDEFIEAHVYGSMTRHTFEQVTIKRPAKKARALLVNKLRKTLSDAGIRLEVTV